MKYSKGVMSHVTFKLTKILNAIICSKSFSTATGDGMGLAMGDGIDDMGLATGDDMGLEGGLTKGCVSPS